MASRGTMESLCLAAALASFGFGIPASDAGQRRGDHAYADSFGNLVVDSRAGYKRIVVGKGYLAAELNIYSSADDADGAKAPDLSRSRHRVADCYRPPVLLKGRDYMYGLRDGELPEPSGSCFDR